MNSIAPAVKAAETSKKDTGRKPAHICKVGALTVQTPTLMSLALQVSYRSTMARKDEAFGYDNWARQLPKFLNKI